MLQPRAAGHSYVAGNKNAGDCADPENHVWNTRDDDTGHTICRGQRIGVGTNRGASGGTAWADTSDAAAKGAYDPRAMPSRTAKIMRGRACRRR